MLYVTDGKRLLLLYRGILAYEITLRFRRIVSFLSFRMHSRTLLA